MLIFGYEMLFRLNLRRKIGRDRSDDESDLRALVWVSWMSHLC